MSIENRLPTEMDSIDPMDWQRMGDLLNETSRNKNQFPIHNRQAALSPRYFPNVVTNLGQGSLETTIGQDVYTGTEYMQHRPLQMQTPVFDLPHCCGGASDLLELFPSTSDPWNSIPGDFNIFERPASDIAFQNVFPMENQYGGHAFLPRMLEDGGLDGFLAGPSDFATPASAAPQPSSALYNPPSAVAIPAQARPQRPQNKQAGNELLTCPKGCEKTFRRAGDFRRHMKKHSPPMYRCPFNGCDRTFYRKDKAFDHSKIHEARFRHVLVDE